MLKAAKWGYGWVVERTVITPTAPEELRGWRADPAEFDSHGHPVFIGAMIKNLPALSYLTSGSAKAPSRTETLPKDTEAQKKRVPNTTASIKERIVFFLGS